MDTILVVDGDHSLRRAHHTAPDLTDGEVCTGGLFGFLAGLHRTLEAVEPKACVVVWDAGLSAWRKGIFPGYKDRRSTSQKDAVERQWHGRQVRQQADELHNTVLPMIGVPSIRLPGCEADDVIYLARRRVLQKHHVTLLSSDKDFLQMVNSRTSIFDAMKRSKDNSAGTLITVDNFRQITKFETGRQYLHFKIMRGDESDRIPGIKGVGKKTAEKLILQYGSLEGLLDNREEISAMGGLFAKAVTPAAFEAIHRNMQLIALSQRVPDRAEEQAVRAVLARRASKPDMDALESYAQRRFAVHFADNLIRWYPPVRELYKRYLKVRF